MNPRNTQQEASYFHRDFIADSSSPASIKVEAMSEWALLCMTELSEDSVIPGSLRHALLPEMRRGGIVVKNQGTAFLANVSQEMDLHLDRVSIVFG
jgi:hypothetical protein